MQEVNSLCTDRGPLRANTVLCHSTQYSLLVISVVTELKDCLRSLAVMYDKQVINGT